MIEIQSIAEGWLEDEQPVYRKLRAIREATAGCPCDRCSGQQVCKQSGHECSTFKFWAMTGSTTTGAKK